METNRTIDEKELLLQLKDGDKVAFSIIYQKYSLTIYANIMRMVHSEDAADDLLQEVFLNIWENRHKIDPEKSFKGYLLTCSKFLVLNFLRHITIGKQVENYLINSKSTFYHHIEENLIYKDTEEVFQKVVAQLPPQRRKIYTMCKIEGKSYSEVADVLGISISTVQDHIVKASRFIKDRIAIIGIILLVSTNYIQPLF